jgi:hypothetical protein
MTTNLITKIISMLSLITLTVISTTITASSIVAPFDVCSKKNRSYTGFKPTPYNFHLQNFTMQVPCSTVSTWSVIRDNSNGTRDLKLDISEGYANNIYNHLTLAFIQGPKDCATDCEQSPYYQNVTLSPDLIAERNPPQLTSNPAYTSVWDYYQYSGTKQVPINTPLGINYVTKKKYPFGIGQTNYFTLPNYIQYNANVFAVHSGLYGLPEQQTLYRSIKTAKFN